MVWIPTEPGKWLLKYIIKDTYYPPTKGLCGITTSVRMEGITTKNILENDDIHDI